MNHDEALERLLIGNRRYAAMRQMYPRQTYAAMRQMYPRQTTYHRQTLIDGQHPFAAILSCSDSRVPSELIFVPSELIFDQGLGDLFIVRTAGHAVNDLVIASLEYAVYALKVPLIIVMGHAQCGAVTSVMRAEADHLPGHLPHLAALLRPAMSAVDPASEDAIDQAIQANSRTTVGYLASSSLILNAALQTDSLRIAAAHYDLATGRVDLLNI